MKYLFCFRSDVGSLGRSVGITYGDLIGLNHTRHAFTGIFSITGGYIVRIGQVDTVVLLRTWRLYQHSCERNIMFIITQDKLN